MEFYCVKLFTFCQRYNYMNEIRTEKHNIRNMASYEKNDNEKRQNQRQNR